MSGTDYVAEHGGLALNNCSAITTDGELTDAIEKMYILLSNGCGVGFDLKSCHSPCEKNTMF